MANKVRWYWLCFLLYPGLLIAQTNRLPVQTYPSNRYLLVVETSRSMLNRSGMLAQTVQDLLNSAIASQARRGDSLGVWTFNEELYAGTLPLQHWVPENQKAIANHVLGFLQAQKFEKKGQLAKLLPSLLRVVKGSPFLTVILVCTGDEEIHGTPFDQNINAFFQNWRQQQTAARTPFVVALRAQNGALVDCSMNPSPWPVELPVLPKELFVAIPAPAPPPAARQNAAMSAVPPLIISGRKHEPAGGVANAGAADIKPLAGVAPTADGAPHSSEPTTKHSGVEESPKAPDTPSAVRAEPAGEPVSNGLLNRALVRQVPTPAADTSVSAQPSAAETKTAAEKVVKGPSILTGAKVSGGQATSSEAALPEVRVREGAPGQHKINEPARPAVSNMSVVRAQVASVTPGGRPVPITILCLCLAGVALIGTGVTAVWVWRRRARCPGEISLITESIDRRNR